MNFVRNLSGTSFLIRYAFFFMLSSAKSFALSNLEKSFLKKGYLCFLTLHSKFVIFY
jgi:hypothetical protein